MKKSMRNSGFHLGKAASCVMVTAIPRIFALKRGVPQCHRAYCAGRPAWPHPNRRRSDYRWLFFQIDIHILHLSLYESIGCEFRDVQVDYVIFVEMFFKGRAPRNLQPLEQLLGVAAFTAISAQHLGLKGFAEPAWPADSGQLASCAQGAVDIWNYSRLVYIGSFTDRCKTGIADVQAVAHILHSLSEAAMEVLTGRDCLPCFILLYYRGKRTGFGALLSIRSFSVNQESPKTCFWNIPQWLSDPHGSGSPLWR